MTFDIFDLSWKRHRKLIASKVPLADAREPREATDRGSKVTSNHGGRLNVPWLNERLYNQSSKAYHPPWSLTITPPQMGLSLGMVVEVY